MTAQVRTIEQKIAEAIAILQEFRQNLYNFFPLRGDALMELIDALASNSNARSVVELSLSPLFRQEYGSVYDAIEHFFVPSATKNAVQEQRAHEQEILGLITPYLPAPQQRKYWLFGTDVTYLPRQFAQTLGDRTFVHCPNTIKGNNPVTIGHDYSVLSFLPEKVSAGSPPWVVPLIVRRVKSTEKASQVGAEQISAVVAEETSPFKGELSVHVADSAFSAREHLGSVAIIENLVSVIRLPGNRVVYRQYELPEGEKNPVGHPTWYGDRFDLKDPDTWPEPDETAETTFVTKKGKTYDVEHFFRYGKQRLLMAAFQTPDVEREENWWWIVQLAYIQLWLARSLAETLPNPWERYLPQSETGEASPSTVQRDFEQIIQQIGTPAQPPKRRGNSSGRIKGDKPPPRPRQPVIKKG